MNSLVSIIMPYHNGAQFVEDTLHSVIQQTHQHWELLISNDGSTATDRQQLQGILLRLAEPRIRVLDAPKGNVSVARNRAMREARGQFIAFLDADDLWRSDKLRAQLSSPAPEGGLSYTLFRLIDAQGVPLREQKDYHNRRPPTVQSLLLRNNVWGGCSGVMLPIDCLQRVGYFNEQLVGAEDWDYWIRCSQQGYVFHQLPLCCVSIRCHDTNVSRNATLMAQQAWLCISQYVPQLPWGQRIQVTLTALARYPNKALHTITPKVNLLYLVALIPFKLPNLLTRVLGRLA